MPLSGESTMHIFKFVWSPEGRTLTTIAAKDLKTAKAQFKRDFPPYARFMGEVYIVEVLPAVAV